MKPLIVVLLSAQVLLLLSTAWTILRTKRMSEGSRSVWLGLWVSLLAVASVSGGMAGRYEGAPGARLLEYGSGVMLGMSVMSMLVLLRERMRRDAAA